MTGIIVNGESRDLSPASPGAPVARAIAPEIAFAVFAATGRRLRAQTPR
jgi:hypothetical protein